MHKVVDESAIPVGPAGSRPRLDSIDFLRGAVMILMALDHTRDFFHRDAGLINPTDLSQTSLALFLTRWITHYCAPVFCFLAGTGAFLSLGRGRSKRDVSWFLLTRGFWLVVLELTLVNAGWLFRFDLYFHFLQVIWVLGWSMIVLAALVHLPLSLVAAYGVILIAGHNLLDGVRVSGFWNWLWLFLHVPGVLEFGQFQFFLAYPLIPWSGVMALGYAFGALVRRDPAERRRIFLRLGLAITAGFVLLRASNLYGNPEPWTSQATPAFTVLSFIDCYKYPPSLLFLMMTLGPALIALALLDRPLGRFAQPVIIFGRVPLFFYLLHIPLIHGLAVLTAWALHGSAGGIWNGPPGFPGVELVPGWGFSLPVVYLWWALVVLLLYWPCRWFAELKQRRRDAWLSYF